MSVVPPPLPATVSLRDWFKVNVPSPLAHSRPQSGPAADPLPPGGGSDTLHQVAYTDLMAANAESLLRRCVCGGRTGARGARLPDTHLPVRNPFVSWRIYIHTHAHAPLARLGPHPISIIACN